MVTEHSPLKTLWKHFTSTHLHIYEASSYSILNKIFDIAPPLLIGLAVDTVVKNENSFLAGHGVVDKKEQIYVIGILTVIIWVLESAFEYLLKIRWRGIAQDVQHKLRVQGYEHLQRLQLSYFEDQNTGNLTTILNDDINQLERFLDSGANSILQMLTTVFTIGTVFFIISPTLASLSFLPIPFILWGSFYFQKKIAPKYANVRQEAGNLASTLVNNLAGMATIKSYVAQEFETSRIENQSLDYVNSNKSAIKVSSAFSPLIRMVILCGFMFTLVLGGLNVFDGKLEVGAYSILIFLVQRLLWPLTLLGETFDLYQRAMASTIRVMDLLNTPIKINDGKSSFTYKGFEGEVKFENVSFRYSNGTQVLKDISIEMPAKKTIALVGTTGSGKSSILKLLLRFYDVSGGKILVDNIDVKDLEQDELRSNIGYVSQDIYLFHGSVKDNISYGTFSATDEEITEAAKKAEAHDFIMSLPQGYETVIGERGQKLSGGQRQRISIARAILKNPPLFIFDEATSAVDNETEAAIQRSLEQITKNATTLMVAHRLSTIKNADMIYVLENGSIRQQGIHDKLVQEEGIYQMLWDVQTGNKRQGG